MTPAELDEIEARAPAGHSFYEFSDVHALIAEVRRLRKALAFYGSARHVRMKGPESPLTESLAPQLRTHEFVDPILCALVEAGKVARDALELE